MKPSILRALQAAGATVDMIVAAVEAEHAEREAEAAARREKAREKKRRQRAEKAGMSPDVPGTDGDNTGHEGTTGDTLSLPPSPRTPQPPTHTRDRIPSRARDAREPEGFERFWSLYPRKVGKPKAQMAYAAALRRAGHDPPSTILAGLQAHLPGWTETEPELIPHPTTWLNRDGWNDDPPRPRVVPLRAHDRPDHHPRSARDDRLGRCLAGAAEVLDG